MKGKKFLALLLCAVLTFLVLAGCANDTQPAATPDSSVSSEQSTAPAAPTVLNVTMALSDEEWTVMREHVFPAFEAQYNAKIEAVQVEASDVVKKLQAMNSAGKMEIDVIAQDVNNTFLLVANGLMEDLTADADIVPDAAIGTLGEAGIFGDQVFFLPYRPNVEINYYNSVKFDQYGLTPPTNWEELLSTAKELKDQEGIGRLCLKLKLSGDIIEIAEFIRSAGGDPLVLDDPGTIAAYEYLQELWPYLSENTLKAGFSSTNDFLSKDEVYYAPNWPYGSTIMVRDNGKTEIMATPGFAGPEGFVKTLGGEMLGIPVGSPNKELALDFIAYLESAEVQTILLTQNGWPSFRDDVYGEVEEWQKPYIEATQAALAVAQPLPNVPYWSEVNQALNDALREVVLDGKDATETLTRYAAQVEQAKAALGG